MKTAPYGKHVVPGAAGPGAGRKREWRGDEGRRGVLEELQEVQ